MPGLLYKYLKDYKLIVSLIMCFLLADAFGQVMLPRVFEDMVRNGIANNDFGYIFEAGRRMIFFTALIGVCTTASCCLSAYVTAAFTSRIRGDMFHKIQSFSELDFLRFSKETLLVRTNSDTTPIQMVVLNGLRSMVSVPFLGLFALINCIMRNPPLAAMIIICFALSVWFIVRSTNRSIPLFAEYQKKLDRINMLMNEKLSGVRSIRAFNRQEYELEKLAAANQEGLTAIIRANLGIILVFPVAQLLMSLAIVLILWFGSMEVQYGVLEAGNLLVFVQYSLILMNSLTIVTPVAMLIPRARVASARINEVFAYEPVIHEPESRSVPEFFNGEITFENVQFGYAGAENLVLHDISFTIPAGKTTAIVGATGSGKSTLLKLILRFYDVNFFGRICIDGVDVKRIDNAGLRRAVSYAPQKASLFSGSIYENLLVGNRDADEEEALEACEIAQVTQFLDDEKGIHKELNQGGSNLSGGQKQRVSLARAFIKHASVYLLDDSFSALDFKTESLVRSAMYKKLSGKTIVIVAQRISTIMHADSIIVLDGGRVAGIGVHEELLSGCDVYRAIYQSQTYVKNDE